MTIGFGARTICGTWIDRSESRRVLNVFAFGWHYQIHVSRVGRSVASMSFRPHDPRLLIAAVALLVLAALALSKVG